MTEHKSKKFHRPLRAALVAATVAAMMVVGVAAANPEAAQGFFTRIISSVWVDEYRQDLTTQSGERVTTLKEPETALENRDGRVVLVVDNQDAADITDALNTEGRYVYERKTEGTVVTITVEGTVDRWEMEVSMGTADGKWFGSSHYSSEEPNGLGGVFMDGTPWESVELDKNGQVTGTVVEQDGSYVSATVTVVDEDNVPELPESIGGQGEDLRD